MKLLVDTHVFLWFILDDPRIKATARPLLIDPEHDRFISIASVWEVAIKHGLGKLQLAGGMPKFMEDIEQANFAILDILPGHIMELATLPLHHRDPFDRMLIAQAKHEGMHLLTADPLCRVWCAGDRCVVGVPREGLDRTCRQAGSPQAGSLPGVKSKPDPRALSGAKSKGARDTP